MKVAIVCLTLVSLAFSAPQERKVFHENFEDFLNLITETVGEQLGALVEEYIEFEEFRTSLDYIMTNDFKNLVYEMESLPEFKAVIDFLEQDNIDITYFLDLFNELLESAPVSRKSARISGSNFNSFVADCIEVLPKDQLSALFDQKMADDEEFRGAMENLYSAEWQQIFDALWASPVFQAEVVTLAQNGIDVHVLLRELVAIFGQN